MRITVALSIIAASASVALAATLDIPREIVIGLSPFQPAPDRTNQQYVLQRFLLGQCPTSTRVVVWDAWQIQVIADVQPYSLSYDSPAARAPRLAQALAGLGRWSASSSAGRTADTLKDSDAIKVPEWLDAVAATPPTGRRTVVILASPFCLVPDEPSFSMVQTRFPSDGHLNRTTADSVYGTADKRGHLAQTVVLWAYSSEDLFASQYHRRSISRWWSLYIASQGPNATLCGLQQRPGPDPVTVPPHGPSVDRRVHHRPRRLCPRDACCDRTGNSHTNSPGQTRPAASARSTTRGRSPLATCPAAHRGHPTSQPAPAPAHQG